MRQFFLLFIFFILSAFNSADFLKENAVFLSTIKDKKINVVAPASGKDPSVIKDLQSIPSISLKLPFRCFNAPKTSFHSASDEIRLECLKEALLDKSSNVIWALRGGHGSAKLISKLSQLPKPESKKFFIGYSDITALHLFFTQNWGWRTIHGAGIAEILDKDKARTNFTKISAIIEGKIDKAVIPGLTPLNLAARKSKNIRGVLNGGNLTMVQASIGTPWQISTLKKILFLEDVGIKAYQLDRTLYHLKQAGLFNEIKAVIFGQFDGTIEENLNVLKDFANHLKVPVFKSNRFGHGKLNDPIIYNVDTNINLNIEGTYDLVMKLK